MTTFTLITPISFVLSGAHGPTRRVTISEVQLRKVRAGDLRLLEQFKGRPTDLVLHAVSAMSGLTAAQIKKIEIEDYAPIAQAALRAMASASSAIGVRPEFFIPPDASL